MNLDGFKFPTDDYYAKDLQTLWPAGNIAQAEENIRSFFKRISVFFAIAASDQVLDTQALAVFSRIPTEFQGQRCILSMHELPKIKTECL